MTITSYAVAICPPTERNVRSQFPCRKRSAMAGDEAPHLRADLRILRYGAEAKARMRHGFPHVQLRLDTGATQLSMHQHRVGQEQIACAGLDEGRWESAREVGKKWRHIRIGQRPAGCVERIALWQAGFEVHVQQRVRA